MSLRYFCMMTGLRGCYMPDSVWSFSVATRRELKAILAEEAERMTGDRETRADARAASERYSVPKHEVASVAAALWRRRPTDRDSHLSTVIPYGRDDAFGIQVNPISREEYLSAREQQE